MTDFASVAETAEVANADTTDPDVAGYNFPLLRLHLSDTHRNKAADDLTDAEAVDQHHHEHHGPGGLRLHDHPDSIPPTRWENLHPPQAGTAVEAAHPDVIAIDRKIGATRAKITLQSGAIVTGEWAAGDCQALRRLVETLARMVNVVTESHTKALRGNSDMNADNRDLRDQLVVALNDNAALHLAREHWTDQTSRVGQLMAEITTLQAQLGSVAASTTPEEAALLRQRNQAERSRVGAEARAAAAEARADASEVRAADLARQLADQAAWGAGARDFIQRHAIDAAMAADQAVKEEAWKNAGRLLKLANMWTSLLAAVDFPPEAPPTEST